jgi:hypothetical protein
MKLFGLLTRGTYAHERPASCEPKCPPRQDFAGYLNAPAPRAVAELPTDCSQTDAGATRFDRATLFRTTDPAKREVSAPNQDLPQARPVRSAEITPPETAASPALPENPAQTTQRTQPGDRQTTPRQIRSAPLGVARTLQPAGAAPTPVESPPDEGSVEIRPLQPTAQRRSTLSFASPVLVALHAIEGELNVYARPGRMAPTERQRLRNAIGALLAQFGIFNASVFVEHGGGEPWLK